MNDTVETSNPPGMSGFIAGVMVGLTLNGLELHVIFHDQSFYTLTIAWTNVESMFKELVNDLKKTL